MKRRLLCKTIMMAAAPWGYAFADSTDMSMEGIPAPLVAQVMGQLANALNTGPLTPSVEIVGEFVMDGDLLYTTELVFKSGSKLIMAGSSFGVVGQKTIIAKKINIEPGAPAPMIVWQRGDADRRVPPSAGKAPPGESGIDNGNGQPGYTGLSGNRGVGGQNAPNLFILCREITGAVLEVDLRGMDGGKGGQGQTGGNGGYGKPGDGAVSGLYKCANEAGDGGNGANGGRGGRGGMGGRGGNGGSIAILRPDNHEGLTAKFFRVYLTGGRGGEGGDPGVAGDFGRLGAGGPKSGYCMADGKPGKDGDSGENGTSGPRGEDGSNGEFREGHLPPNAAFAASLG